MAKVLMGKVALVTGGSRGIGRSAALMLADLGCVVAVHYGSNETAALSTVEEIRQRGGESFPLRARLTDAQSVDALFSSLDAELAAIGRKSFDILVNNSGIGGLLAFSETDEATYDELFAVNTKAPFFIVQSALPRLNDGGRIINISSMVSLVASPGCVAYAMTKAALNALTTALAKEAGPRGITVNAVAPGATETDFFNGLPDGFVDAVIAQTPMGRIGQPDDIARIVAFLATPASDWVTGQVIRASGGTHL